MPAAAASCRDLVESLLETLRKLPDTTVEIVLDSAAVRAPGGKDTVIRLRIFGAALGLQLTFRKSVYPRDARELLWGSANGEGWTTEQLLRVVVAEEISPGAKEQLRTGRIGYFDLGGNLFLPATGAFVFLDRPASKRSVRTVRTLFAGRRAQVLAVMLERAEAWFRVTSVAEEAQVAASTAQQVFGELERHDWVETRGLGPKKERRLTAPGPLLDAWVDYTKSGRAPAMRRYFVPKLSTEVLMRRIGEVCADHQVAYAVTHESAAQRYAPYLSAVSQVRIRMAPGRAADSALVALGARAVEEGANLVVIDQLSSTALPLTRLVDGICLASPVQVYLDLVASEGRASDMAAHLRQETIGY